MNICGKASRTSALLTGNGDKATYALDLKLTSRNRMLTHVGARIVLRDPGTNPNLPNTATS